MIKTENDMSGGRFDYLQNRYEFLEAIEGIQDNIINNEYGYSLSTINEFKTGLNTLLRARVYLQRIDWLLSGDDGEATFHERLKEDLNNIPLQ